MGKPLIEERGLQLVPLDQAHIRPFVEDISPETMREFETLYATSPTETLEDLVDEPLVFSVMKDGRPVAITGLVLHTKDALMWAIFTKGLRKHWVSFARASQKLIQFYHTLHPNLRSEVWVKNEMIHQWLLHLGFLPEAVIDLQNGQSVVRFVRCIPEHKSAQTATSRPVLH